MLVPPDWVKTIVAPPAVMALPAASLPRKRTNTELPDATEEFATSTVERSALMAPGVTVMLGNIVVTGVPLIVAVILVAEPRRTPVNTAS